MSILSWPGWVLRQPSRMLNVMVGGGLPAKPLHIAWVDADPRGAYNIRALRGRTSMWAEEAADILVGTGVVLMNAGPITPSARKSAITPGFRFWRSALYRRMQREASILRTSWRKQGFGDIVLVFLVDLKDKRGWYASRSGFILMDTSSGRGSTLAHELGHYADLMHRKDATNLMKPGSRSSNHLTRFQRRMINTAVSNAPIMLQSDPGTALPGAEKRFLELMGRIGSVDTEYPWHSAQPA